VKIGLGKKKSIGPGISGKFQEIFVDAHSESAEYSVSLQQAIICVVARIVNLNYRSQNIIMIR